MKYLGLYLLVGVFGIVYAQSDGVSERPLPASPIDKPAEGSFEDQAIGGINIQRLSVGPDWTIRAVQLPGNGTFVDTWSEPVLTLKQAWAKSKEYPNVTPVERRRMLQALFLNMTLEESLPTFNYKDKHMAVTLVYLLRNYAYWNTPRMQGVIAELANGFALHWDEPQLIAHPEIIREFGVFIKLILSKKITFNTPLYLAAAKRGLISAKISEAGQAIILYNLKEAWDPTSNKQK